MGNSTHCHTQEGSANLGVAKWLSFTCIVHCILTPIIVMVFPLFGKVFHNMWIELGILAVSIICGIWVIRDGYCHHKRLHSWVLFGVGSLFWVLHALLEHVFHNHSHLPLLLIGSVFVLISYYINHKYLDCCDH